MLIEKKDFIIAILVSFILVVTLYPSITASTGDYDPWSDINSDGKIRVDDILNVALLFGTDGDSTRNVTIAGRASKLIKVAEGVSIGDLSSWSSDWISIDGYSKVTIHVALSYPTNKLVIEAPIGAEYQIEVVDNFPYYWTKTYDVMHQQIRIKIFNYDIYPNTLYVDVYLTA